MPLVNLAAWIILLIGLPVALVLLIFRQTRRWGGLIMFIVSLPWWIWLWLLSFVYAVSVSLLWSIIGVVVGGIGIVPVAAIMMLVRADWANLVALLGSSVLVLALRWIGLGIINRAEERDLIEGLQAQRHLEV